MISNQIKNLLSRKFSTLPLLLRHPISPLIPKTADVVIIGGGHAGVEAAAAAYRVFANKSSTPHPNSTPHRIVLLTQRLDTIGEMACNPAIGGVGKGTLVREVDALDGIMGNAADASGIHFKVLNRSRGPAVQGPRCQCDRSRYKNSVQSQLVALIDDELNPHVEFHVVEASADDLIIHHDENGNNFINGVVITPTPSTTSNTNEHQNTDIQNTEISKPPSSPSSSSSSSSSITAPRVVVTTGTFLRGRVHLGRVNYPAGRHLENSEQIEPPSTALANTFERLGLPLSTLNTGTPPRLDGSTINWKASSMEKQDSETSPELEPLSFMTDQPQVLVDNPNHQFLPTMQTYTNSNTHQLISNHLNGLPTYRTNEGKLLQSERERASRIWKHCS